MELDGHNLEDMNVIDYIHTDFVCFKNSSPVGEVIAAIRARRDDGRIVYYYVVDENEALVGVLPARMLVTKDPETRIGDICIRDIVAVDSDTNLYDVAKIFETYKYLSLPVLNDKKQILGVIDLHIFTHKELDISNKLLVDEVFQTIGIRLGSLLHAKPAGSFLLRVPWLVSTIAGGFLCAFFSGLFELTFSKSILLTLFLSMVLAIGESSCIQSMTIIVQMLSIRRMEAREILGRLWSEARVGMLLGAFCGFIVACLSIVWKGLSGFSLVLLLSIVVSVIAACLIGSFLPWLLFRLKINVRIASGPIVLATTDVTTIIIYLGIAALILT
jgi:magnesium transporter